MLHKTGPDGQQMLPFYLTIKRTAITKDAKIQELRVKMSQTVYFQDSPQSKADMLPSSGIQERIKKEQIASMFIPRMKELVLG